MQRCFVNYKFQVPSVDRSVIYFSNMIISNLLSEYQLKEINIYRNIYIHVYSLINKLYMHTSLLIYYTYYMTHENRN